jgi:uncharacterized protein (UPF0333 family)
MDNKAQGALEYLLLLGGVIVIAIIVVVIVSGLGKTGKNTASSGSGAYNNAIGNMLNQIKE